MECLRHFACNGISKLNINHLNQGGLEHGIEESRADIECRRSEDDNERSA